MATKLRDGLVAGIAAGAVAIALSYALRLAFGAVFLPEIAAQTLFTLTPGEIESQLIASLGYLAKYSAITGAAIVNLIIYGLLGKLLISMSSRVDTRFRSLKPLIYSATSFTLFFIIALVLVGLTEILTTPTNITAMALQMIIPNLVYGYLLHGAAALQAKPRRVVCEARLGQEVSYRRRLFIKTAPIAVVAATLAVYGLATLLASRQAPNKAVGSIQAPQGGDLFKTPIASKIAEHEVTPNELFYRVDVNVITPSVDVDDWVLEVGGLVERPLRISYEELRSMPAVEEYATLECVSNKIGGDLMSTALWKGVRLRDILERAGVKPEATYIVFKCRDNYDVAIPLERGMLEGTILAYEMNGETLPREHGFPIRAVVPGLYGMMNAKWITSIELVNFEYLGFWQRRGWTNKAEYKTHSTILTPGKSSLRKRFGELPDVKPTSGQRSIIAGVAFAGDRGIERVEVSVDGGRTWSEASIKDPLSGYTWVLWAAEWTPPSSGVYRIMVRATDKNGETQTAEVSAPFPEGATGYHVIDIRVL